MAAVKRFPNENAEETRRDHIEYLEDKKKEFTKLLETLEKEKDELEADEAALVDGHGWAVRQKETLTRDFENILEEELKAIHAQVKKTPQEVEAELNGGEPDLQTRFELFRESKRKVLVSLMEVEDEEIDNVDEEKQLRTKREELTRRTKEAEEKLASVEKVLIQVRQAMKEQEAAQSTRKEQVAAPPVEHGGNTRKRKAMEAGEESQPKKQAEILRGLEEEQSEDEEEEDLRQREEPGRKEKPAAINERELVQKNTNIRLTPNGPVQAEEVSREKEANAGEQPAAAAHATQQPSTSKQSASRGDRQPTSAGARISLDELKQVVANMDFHRGDDNKIYADCPISDVCAELCGCPAEVCRHFVAHLHKKDRPYLCSQAGCKQTMTHAAGMQRHFESCHKELTWNDEIKNECKVSSSFARLNAIQQLIGQRAGPLNGKLAFDQLEAQVRDSTLTREPNGSILFKCSVCSEEFTATARFGRAKLVGQHLRTHLAGDYMPFACPIRGCKHMSARLPDLKRHFSSAHKELQWTAQDDEKSAVTGNVERLEALVKGLLAAKLDEHGLSLDELKSQAAHCTFTRNAKGALRMTCSVCSEQIIVIKSQKITLHLVSHLRRSSQPVRCREDGCSYKTGSLQNLKKHIRSVHGGKELTKQMAKDCEVLHNKKQLEEIVASIFSRRPPKAS